MTGKPSTSRSLVLVEPDPGAPSRATAVEARVEWGGELLAVKSVEVTRNTRLSALALPLDVDLDPFVARPGEADVDLLLPSGAPLPRGSRWVLRAGPLRVTLSRVGDPDADLARNTPSLDRRGVIVVVSGLAHVALLALAAQLSFEPARPVTDPVAYESALRAQIEASIAADEVAAEGVPFPGPAQPPQQKRAPAIAQRDVTPMRDFAREVDAPATFEAGSPVPAPRPAPRHRAPVSDQAYIALNAATVRARPSRTSTRGS